MHYVFYGLGGIAAVASGFAFFIGATGGNNQVMMLGLVGALGAVVWLGIGRGLELIERIADAIAPEREEPDHADSARREVDRHAAAMRRGL